MSCSFSAGVWAIAAMLGNVCGTSSRVISRSGGAALSRSGTLLYEVFADMSMASGVSQVVENQWAPLLRNATVHCGLKRLPQAAVSDRRTWKRQLS